MQPPADAEAGPSAPLLGGTSPPPPAAGCAFGPEDKGRSLLHELWACGAWRYLLLALLADGACLTIGFLVSTQASFFASRAAGHSVDCASDPAPAGCDEAAGEAVRWSSGAAAAQGVASALLAPVLGSASDRWGRRPALALACSLAAVQPAALWAYVSLGWDLRLYYIGTALAGATGGSAPLLLSCLADVAPPRHRGSLFGVLLGTITVGFSVLPSLGARLGLRGAVNAQLAAAVAQAPYVWLALPEPTSSASRGEAAVAGGGGGGLGAMAAAARILRRSPLFARLAAVALLSSAGSSGLQEVIAGYFTVELGMGPAWISAYLAVVGVSITVTSYFLIHVALRTLGEHRVLACALAAWTLHAAGLALARSPYQALAAGALASVGFCSFPALAALKANAAGAAEQGAVQGALYGAKSAGAAVGPFLLGTWVFAETTSPGSGYPQCPSAALWAAALLGAAALAVSLTLEWPPLPGARRAGAPAARSL